MRHKDFVNELYSNPSKIEPAFRSIFKEFSVGHGRIDLVGKDRNGNLCLVEVKLKDKEIPSARVQIRKYRSQLLQFLKLAGVELTIRAIVVTPAKVIDLGTRKSKMVATVGEIPIDFPTSREIFGLKRYEKEKIAASCIMDS